VNRRNRWTTDDRRRRMSGSRHSGGRRSEGFARFGRAFALSLIIAVASVSLLAAAHTSVKTTASLMTRGEVAASRSAYEGYLCVQKAFHRAVPKGADVYLGHGPPFTSQLLAEVATLWARPVIRPSDARWSASLVPSNGCGGFDLRVHRIS
jgi:hypothetical protein